MRRRELLGLLGGGRLHGPALRAQEPYAACRHPSNGDAAVPHDLEIARELARIGYIRVRTSLMRFAASQAT